MQIGDLRTHEKIHTGEEPYGCKIYKALQNLKNHEKIHSIEKPHKCTKCQKTFRWLNAPKFRDTIHSAY